MTVKLFPRPERLQIIDPFLDPFPNPIRALVLFLLVKNCVMNVYCIKVSGA